MFTMLHIKLRTKMAKKKLSALEQEIGSIAKTEIRKPSQNTMDKYDKLNEKRKSNPSLNTYSKKNTKPYTPEQKNNDKKPASKKAVKSIHTSKPYSIYENDKSWIIAAERTRMYLHAGWKNSGLGNNGLITGSPGSIDLFVSENESIGEKYIEQKTITFDHENFLSIFNILELIQIIRKYNLHLPHKIGDHLDKHNKIDTIKRDIEANTYIENPNKNIILGEKQKIN